MPSDAASRRPFLLGRFDCPTKKKDEIDAWIPKHLDDSLAHAGIVSTAYYHIVRDLPALLSGPGNRSVIYDAVDLDGMLAWMDSPELAGAVDDSSDRETLFYPIDGESPGTSNICEVSDVRHRGTPASGGTAVVGQRLLVERFEVGDDQQDEFDGWLGNRLEAVASWPLVSRTRIVTAYRDAPDRFPFDRYRSIGNRMLLADIDGEGDLLEWLCDAAIAKAFRDSQSWDFVLPYVRREIYDCVLVRGEETS